MQSKRNGGAASHRAFRAAAHFVVITALCFGTAVRADGPTLTLRLHQEANGQTSFEVVGLAQADPAKLTAGDLRPDLFAVYVKGAADAPPILGSYRVADSVLRFEPRFPLRQGLDYRAVFHAARLPGHT